MTTPMPGDVTKPLTDDELRAMRERCDKATPGPVTAKYPVNHDFVAVRLFCGNTYIGSITNSDMDDSKIAANAEFYSNARTDIPRLLDEVERLRAKLAEYRGKYNQAQQEVLILRGAQR